MTEHRNGDRPVDLPQMPREFPQLPKLPLQPSVMDLARAYATLSAAYHQNWPALLGELDEIKSHLDVLAGSVRRIEDRLKPGGEVDIRAKQASSHDLAEVVGVVAHEVAEQTGRHHSIRVREIATSVVDARELDEVKARAKFRNNLIIQIVAALVTLAVGILVGKVLH